MKIGDLIKVEACPTDRTGIGCSCFFCKNSSNGIGVVLGPSELNMWFVMFDAGEWELYEHEAEVISECR
jgi:hypothetical protein